MLIEELAINGGKKIREKEWPTRGHFGSEEKQAVMALFDEAEKSGAAPGYNGKYENAYCDEFAAFMGGGFADAVNSGTNAVYVALKSLDLEPFSEVIVGAVTDPGGMMPIPLLGCIPVVADAEPDSFNTSAAQIEPLINERTSAILIAHIAGNPADIEDIVKLAAKHNIPVVEDCAQAHGAKINGKMVGTFGNIGCFSTMNSKHHCTGGQGGVVFTKDEDQYWRIRRSSDRGKPFNLASGSSNECANINCNLSELGGVIGSVQLKKVPGMVASRRKAVGLLREKLKKETKVFSIAEEKNGYESSHWFVMMKLALDKISCDKNTLCEALFAENFTPFSPSYTAALPHLKDWFVNKRALGKKGFPWTAPQYKGDPDREYPIPNAIKACEDHINLQLNESYTESDIEDIVAIARKVESAYLK